MHPYIFPQTNTVIVHANMTNLSQLINNTPLVVYFLKAVKNYFLAKKSVSLSEI